MLSADVAARNGFAPDSISKTIVPKLKMSERWSTCSPRTCSGDM